MGFGRNSILEVILLIFIFSACLRASPSQTLLQQRRGGDRRFFAPAFGDVGNPYNEDYIYAGIDEVASPYQRSQEEIKREYWGTSDNNNYQQPYGNGNADYLSSNYNNVQNSYGSSSSNNYNNNEQNPYNGSPYTSSSSSTSTSTSTTTSTTAAPAALTCGRSKSGMIDPFGVSNQTPPTRSKQREILNALFDSVNRIVGGVDARQGEVCWQVNLLDNRLIGDDKGYCGGSILSDRWILTAAHCVANSSTEAFITPANLMVLAGSIVSDPSAPNNLTNTACSQRLATSRIIVNPNFRQRNVSTSPYLYVNDLALVELATPINLDSACSCPICLATPAKQPFVGQLGVASGFGCQVTDPDCPQTFPLLLQWTQTMFVPDSAASCFGRVMPSAVDLEAQRVTLCGGGIPGIGTCQGDSGGPFVQWDNVTMRFYQEGIVSYGSGDNGQTCAGALATRFTEVNQFLPFITQYVPAAQILP